jgi:hypothetical protein
MGDVPAKNGETDIPVEDPTLFHVNVGYWSRKGDSPYNNEDSGLCLLGSDGKPDWLHSEQVQLICVDYDRKVIRVKRGCYGTKPMAFPANKSYAAAHEWIRWYPPSNPCWIYNFSTLCPKDSQGLTCSDALVDDLASHFLPGGDIDCFDGLEFDVPMRSALIRFGAEGRHVDTNGDGKPDDGWIKGVNYFEIGLHDFYQKLRRRLGEEKIIQADGQSATNQRSFGVLNGIESEGWPIGSDWEIEDWSGGINRLLFWNQNARRPVFNFINFRWWHPPTEPPLSRTRLVFAVGQFMDAPICGLDNPEPEPGEEVGLWDELVMGVEHRIGWLGFPLEPSVRLALQTKDMLEGRGKDMSPKFVQQFQGEDVQFMVEGHDLRVSTTKKDSDRLRFVLRDIPCEGSDLFVSLKIKAEEMKDYPLDLARLMWVNILEAEKREDVYESIDDKPPSGERFMTWINPNWFEVGFYFRKVNSRKADLEFEVESGEPIWFKDFSVHAHPDAILREFEKGLVLANPSLHDYTFDLDILMPGKKYRRLIGSSKQDPKTNNGLPTEGKVTLGERDGLFLVKTN